MKYEIKTYQEGYIHDQFRIGSRLYDKWRMGGQTRPEQLKQAYKSENFDPETRFYAFEGEKMVGFLTAAQKDNNGVAFFEFPYTDEGAEDAIPELVNIALNKLREKGFTKLVTRAGPYWGQTKELALKYGFTRQSEIVSDGQINLDEFDSSILEDPSNVELMNFETHGKIIAETMAKVWNITIEQAHNNLSRTGNLKIGETTKNPWDQVLTLVGSYVLINNTEMIGFLRAFSVEAFGSKTVNLALLYAKDGNENIKSKLLHKLIIDAKKLGYHRIIITKGPWGGDPTGEFFKKLGVAFSEKLAFYEKQF